jgi:ABC-type polysaccharide/polyol phosphate export permease
MNLAMFPGWIFSGVFFSTERFPDAVQPLIQALPLTALNDTLRAVMLDGEGWAAVGGELAILGAWGVAGFLLALRLFRWQ